MFTWNDGLCPGGRRPRLYLAKGKEVRKFEGRNIDGYCSVATEQYEKNGKWSNTTFDLVFAHGVRPLEFLSPMHGTWGDNLGSWGEVVEQLGLPIEVAQEIVRAEYPRTGERLDQLEAFACANDGAGEVEVVIVSFGSPTNRAISEGYWSKPKSGQTTDGRTVTIRPGADGDWYAPVCAEPVGSRVISARHKPGMHGGYWTVEVAVPAAPAAK